MRHHAEIAATAVLGLSAAMSTFGAATLAMPPRDSRSAIPEIEAIAAAQPQAQPIAPLAKTDAELFANGANSIVARTIGHAEGTRAATGEKTRAYHGHTDPGNGVWNLGSFSYQHGAASPEDADRKQLARLQRQFAIISQQAASKGLVLSDLEKLNAIDLANQAPLAALGPGAFVDRLPECKRNILCARSRGFLDLATGRLDAPGLGNNMPQVRRDQQRRMDAINSALTNLRR
jgi:hypothetical protein